MTLLIILFGLLGLGVIVFVHEAGHFAAAKLCGVAVETFSLGWGKKLAGFKYKGTTYQIAMFPIGGYCKMRGEMQTPVHMENEDFKDLIRKPGTYLSASWWKKVFISISGPLANVIFALIFLAVTNIIGYSFYSAENRIIVMDLDRETPALAAGLETGDRIIEINGKKTNNFADLTTIIQKNPQKALRIKVERNGLILDKVITPELYKMTGRINVYGWVEPVIREIDEGLAADIAELKPGDRIVAVNNRPVQNDVDIRLALQNRPDRVQLVIMREEKLHIKTLALQYEKDGSLNLGMRLIKRHRSPVVGLAEALVMGFDQVIEVIDITFKGFAYLFSIEKEDLKDVMAGPIRITQMVGEVTVLGFKLGFGNGISAFLGFVCRISVIMALMNLIPIPALDGGQIILSLYMALFKNRVSFKFIYRYQIVGFFIVFLLLTIAVFSDIFNIIG